MHSVRVWALYLAAIFGGGALLAPWMHAAVNCLAAGVPVLEPLANAPFHRYVTRCMMVIALAGLWLVFNASGLTSWRELGLAPPTPNLRLLTAGFGLGFVSLGLVLVVTLAGQGRSWNFEHGGADILRHIFNAGLAAMVASPLEEILFRGGIFGALRKAHGWTVGLLASSVVYAAVHFLDRAQWHGPVVWWSGFWVVGKMWLGTGHAATLVPRFMTLVFAGSILAIAYQRTGNLWYSIGLHSGWIFWLKSYAFLTSDVRGAATWFWGSARLIDGWFAVIVMVCLGVGVWKWAPTGIGRKKKYETGTNHPGAGLA